MIRLADIIDLTLPDNNILSPNNRKNAELFN